MAEEPTFAILVFTGENEFVDGTILGHFAVIVEVLSLTSCQIDRTFNTH
jgi:hypothetical protein